MINKEKEQQKQDNLILPNSTFVALWSLVYSVLIFIYFGVAVFEISFQTSINKLLLNKAYFAGILLLFIIADTFIFLNIGIIVQGRLLNNRYKNLLNYLKTYLFITDLIVIIVLIARIALGIADDVQDNYNVAESCLDLVIILKFLNMHRYEKMLKYYYFSEWSILVFQFLKNLILLAFICHIVGCAFFFIDASLIEMGYPHDLCWLINASAMSNLYYEPLHQQYLYSIYFAIVTLSTIAYGDITPQNQYEVAFVILILTFLLMFYVYIFTQIYEAVTWFNRRSKAINQQKYKLAKYMQRFNISAALSGKIVSHFDFRQRQYKKTNKQIFFNQLSVKLARSYQSIPLKQQSKQFIPKFINRISIQPSIFYSSLTQKFYNPEQQFSPLQFSNSTVQRFMYFIPQNVVVYRTVKAGNSSITEKARNKCWLGINAFFTSQHDENQYWSVLYPMELIAFSFQQFSSLIKIQQRYYEKFLQECHISIGRGQYIEQKNKCLICWCGYHNSTHCTIHRPEIKKKDRVILLRSLSIEQLQQWIKIKPRAKCKRTQKKHKKLIKFQPLKIAPEEKSTQTQQLNQNMFGKYKKVLIMKQQQCVNNWLYYIPKFNISMYQNQRRQQFNKLVKK